MPVARKLWQLMDGGSPALLARRLTIWNTICLFIRVPLSRDFVMSTAWNRGDFGRVPETLWRPCTPRGTRPAGGVPGTWCSLPPFSCNRNVRWWLLRLIVLDVHRDDRADTSEGVEHAPYQRPVAESRDLIYGDRLEQRTGLVVTEDRSPADPDDVFGSLDRCRWVGLERSAGDEPVEAPADGREVLP